MASLRRRISQCVAGDGGWFDALECLASDPSATRVLGARARDGLEAGWSARLDQPVLDPELLREIVA